MPTPGKRSRVRLIVGAVVFAFMILGLWFGGGEHNYNLWRLCSSYEALKHPVGTVRVGLRTDIGVLNGSSNHCDYYVGEIRSYSGSKKLIQDFYANKRVWNPIRGRNDTLELVFVSDTEPAKDKRGWYLPTPVYDLVSLKPNSRTNKRYYIVYIIDPGYPSGLDFRCI